MTTAMDQTFNDSGEKPRFIYKKDVSAPGLYIISMFKDFKGPKGEYDQIGTYQLVDMDENPELTDKKLDNIIKLLGGKTGLNDLSNLTDTRLLFTIVEKEEETDPSIINFRTYDGDGVSTENAVLTLEKGVLKDG